MNDPQRVAVVGATGYAGFELAQLLLRHPKVQKPTFYLRESSAHIKCLTEIFPQLRGWGEAPCKTFSVDAVAGSGAGTTGALGTSGFTGDGGPGTSAEISSPMQVAPDGTAGLVFADSQNNRIRMVTG